MLLVNQKIVYKIEKIFKFKRIKNSVVSELMSFSMFEANLLQDFNKPTQPKTLKLNGLFLNLKINIEKYTVIP